ncbi:MAG: hypothetical protein JJE55_14705 [Flavobacteriaceae bacterium]|nr:hypothetical protein [Flavobacteriaceae bacterium]
MRKNIFSSVISITNGLHRDNRIEREFQALLFKLKLEPTASNAVFKVNYKKPLNSKKEYYQKLILNESESTLADFARHFPENATIPENKFCYAILHNKLDKHAKDISKYIAQREIPEDLNDDTYYIINYLKVSIIRLYAELQEQYGQFSNSTLYTIPEIAEKYFNDVKFNKELIQKIDSPRKVSVKDTSKNNRKPKTSFGFRGKDESDLFKILEKLQLKIDLLENRTSTKQLLQILTTDDFTALDFNIYFEANTTAIRYLFDKLKPQFANLKLSEIERSNKFYTKNDFQLTAQNLSSSKQYIFKEKETIDNIFK